jgi:Ca-activated chloride channel family protein
MKTTGVIVVSKRAFLIVIAIVLAVGASAATKVKDLPEKWRVWLTEEVYPLISREQQKAFLELETEAEREAFAERLWALWAAQSGISTTSFRLNYEDRIRTCRSEYRGTTDDRCRVLLLQGPPDAKKEVDCPDIFYPLEFWQWGYIAGLGQDVTVLFYQPYGVGRWQLWDPFNTRTVLYTITGQMALQAWQSGPDAMYQLMRPEYRCGDGDVILRLLSLAEYYLNDVKTKAAMSHLETGPGAGEESASARFLKFTTLMPKDAKPLDFDLAAKVGSRRGSKMRVSLSATVPSAGLATTKVGDVEVVQLDVTGEIAADSEMADRFRYAFTFPTGAEKLPVVIERELRPGRYQVRLKVADSNSDRAGVREIPLEVRVPEVAPLDASRQAEVDKAIDEAVKGPEAVLSLVGPEGEGISGVQRFTALASSQVASVEFFLDGKSVLTKNRPPFEVELDLGPLPRLATITAAAYDASGNELDRKQLDLNIGRERFHVSLQPVSEADRVGDKVRAVATVNVPADKELDRLELYWNETKVATLYQGPFEALVPVPKTDQFGYLRALAILKDGSQSEDVQFLNAPQFFSGVQVDAVELPVVVLDRSGKPVEGLKQADFKVLENEAPQEVTFFSLQQDLPVRLGIVVDTSGSMEKTLSEVQRVVSGFLRNLLRPRDRAFIVAFSDRPALVQGFTADTGALERALISLRADRETAFFDAVVYGLFQFSGVRGRKAMVVLTDGQDNVSRLDFDKMLAYAQRAGVSIYTIGIDLSITEVRTRYHLSKLANVTGGQAFFLPRDANLQPIYDQIDRELRTQYMLAYTSNSTAPPSEFRSIKVEVSRPDVEVRTIAGYFPSR